MLLLFPREFQNDSTHARKRATRLERAYAPPAPDSPPEGRSFQPELIFVNKLLMLAVPALLLASPAWADTVQIGKTAVEYQQPEGFERADTQYHIQVDALDKRFHTDTEIFAKYVPSADFTKRAENPRAIPSWYIHVAFDRRFNFVAITEASFNTTTYLLLKGASLQSKSPKLKAEIENIVGSALRRKVEIETVEQKGFVNKRPGFHSMAAYGQGKIEGDDGKMTDFQLATMTTFYRTHGKLAAVFQASLVQSPDDLPVFTTTALELAEEITGKP
jgi:hypothetical protein